MATTNQGKAAEYRDLLKGLGFELVTLDQAGIGREAEENFTTFEENARSKAGFYSDLSGVLLKIALKHHIKQITCLE